MPPTRGRRAADAFSRVDRAVANSGQPASPADERPVRLVASPAPDSAAAAAEEETRQEAAPAEPTPQQPSWPGPAVTPGEPAPADADGQPRDRDPSTALAPASRIAQPALRQIDLQLPSLDDPLAEIRERTNDAIPPKVYAKVNRQRQSAKGMDAATIVAAAVTKAYQDGVLPGLAKAYRDRGATTTLFGVHPPKKQNRATSPARLNYNPTRAEFAGYAQLASQLNISRAVLVSLALAHYYDMPDPAALA